MIPNARTRVFLGPLLFLALTLHLPTFAKSLKSAANTAAHHPPAPVYSLGTISIAPTPQRFSHPGNRAATLRAPRSSRQLRRAAEPVPLRVLSRI